MLLEQIAMSEKIIRKTVGFNDPSVKLTRNKEDHKKNTAHSYYIERNIAMKDRHKENSINAVVFAKNNRAKETKSNCC